MTRRSLLRGAGALWLSWTLDWSGVTREVMDALPINNLAQFLLQTYNPAEFFQPFGQEHCRFYEELS